MGTIGTTFSELYFHELDTRDRIFARLQLNYAIYASAIAMLAYMARMVDYSTPCIYLSFFYVGIITTVALLLFSAHATWRALTGHTYAMLPKAKEMYEYDQKLRADTEATQHYNSTYNLNVPLPDHESRFESFVSEAMSQCIDHNYALNETRRYLIRRALFYILCAVIPFGASALLFVVQDMDASSPRKVSTSFSESSPLANKLNDLGTFVAKSQFFIHERNNVMSEPDNKKTTNQTQTPPPPPQPTNPQKPQLQYATESFNPSLPDKEKLLNEGKG
ncbi:hypothetical protein [Aeromonas salmonicida]|uniref:hypothetical protein n=1 Tax=Aeromonas salmonicida TaxID=645 RepID=UPI0038BD4DBD